MKGLQKNFVVNIVITGNSLRFSESLTLDGDFSRDIVLPNIS